MQVGVLVAIGAGVVVLVSCFIVIGCLRHKSQKKKRRAISKAVLAKVSANFDDLDDLDGPVARAVSGLSDDLALTSTAAAAAATVTTVWLHSERSSPTPRDVALRNIALQEDAVRLAPSEMRALRCPPFSVLRTTREATERLGRAASPCHRPEATGSARHLCSPSSQALQDPYASIPADVLKVIQWLDVAEEAELLDRAAAWCDENEPASMRDISIDDEVIDEFVTSLGLTTIPDTKMRRVLHSHRVLRTIPDSDPYDATRSEAASTISRSTTTMLGV